jgi:hypothetical protein
MGCGRLGSAREINIARFALAWVALTCAADVPREMV